MEMKRALRRLKAGKAMGEDRIPNEVWKYGREEIKECGRRVCVIGSGKGRYGRKSGRRE